MVMAAITIDSIMVTATARSHASSAAVATTATHRIIWPVRITDSIIMMCYVPMVFLTGIVYLPIILMTPVTEIRYLFIMIRTC